MWNRNAAPYPYVSRSGPHHEAVGGSPAHCLSRQGFPKRQRPHSLSMFNQLEGLLVDEDISVADLKGCLDVFAREIFGRSLKVRYRASYFPFTEPSLEMDISCVICGGKNSSCRLQGYRMVGDMWPRYGASNVLRYGGIDPEKYNGFAWEWDLIVLPC